MIRNVQWIGLAFVCCVGISPLLAQQPIELEVKQYDSHCELQWSVDAQLGVNRYRVYRSDDGMDFISQGLVSDTFLMDWTGHVADEYSYFVAGVDPLNVEKGFSDTIAIADLEFGDEAMLDMLQEYTFKYFWDFAHPVSGLARERNSSGDIVTMGGSGFGIAAIPVGIERGLITREEGISRMLQIVGFLQFADSYHGVFPHWMHGATGNTVPFSQFDDGGDLVETAFLMQGLLCARAYFDQDTPHEEAIRQGITSLWENVEWDFYDRNDSDVLYWHWSPNFGWQMNFPIRGYNEAMIVYILAAASPTHPVSADMFHTGWAGGNYTNGLSWYGTKLFVGPAAGGPLFFAHYSYIGFDPRDKKDAYCNYFDQNVNHTMINRSYCIDNPLNFEGYSDECWGLTASDDPFGYLAHAPGSATDNGTITPTAALSSMPFTPDESIQAFKHFYREHGERLWGTMGFYDAFNLEEDWFADSYLAIDQGPIVCMVENYRTGLLWDLFMQNPEIGPALDSIGFEEDISSATTLVTESAVKVYPNPARSVLNIASETGGPARISVISLDGKTVFERDYESLVGHTVIHLPPLAPGLYHISLKQDKKRQMIPVIVCQE